MLVLSIPTPALLAWSDLPWADSPAFLNEEQSDCSFQKLQTLGARPWSPVRRAGPEVGERADRDTELVLRLCREQRSPQTGPWRASRVPLCRAPCPPRPWRGGRQRPQRRPVCCLRRESAANLVRSGSQPRQPWRDAAKGSETPQTAAPSTYVSTFLKRYLPLTLAVDRWVVTACLFIPN